jgi:hypothetical protein
MNRRPAAGTVIRVRRTAPRALGNLAVATGRERMTAGVVLNDSTSWALVAMSVLASLAAVVAAVAAWRASRACRLALGQLVTARQEAVVPEREWQERSHVPRRASDAAAGSFRARSDPTPPAPPPVPPVVEPAPPAPEPARQPSRPRVAAPAPVSTPVRRSDMLDDPDHPGTLATALPRRERQASPAAPPEALRTEPLERPRPKPPLGSPDEQEVHPGVFVTTPGRPPAPPKLVPAAPPAPPHPEAPAAPAQPEPDAPPPDPRLEGLADPDPFVRLEAIEQLRGHPARVEVLVRLLYDEFPVVRRQAVRSLRRAGGPVATKALLEVASQDPSAEVRQEAVDALGAMLRDVRSNPA